MQAAQLQLSKRADAIHKAEKQSHLEAGRAVDARFDFRRAVAAVAERLRDIFTAFMKAEEIDGAPRRLKRANRSGARQRPSRTAVAAGQLQVRGHAKVFCHRMFAILASTTEQLMRLVV